MPRLTDQTGTGGSPPSSTPPGATPPPHPPEPAGPPAHRWPGGPGHDLIEAAVAAALSRGATAEAVTVLLRDYGAAVRGYLRAVTRDPEAADEAWSIFSEHAWRGLTGWRGESALRTWVYRVAWNAAGRLRRDPWRRRRLRLSSGAASRLAARRADSSQARAEQRVTALDRLRRDLTDEERSLLALRVDRRLSWAEVAAIMARSGAGLEPAALRKRFERLKERLGREARRRGLLGEA